MAEIYGVGTDGRANYGTMGDVPTNLFGRNDVVFQLYPGTHDAPSVDISGAVSFVGVGSREDVTLSGTALNIANAVSGTVTFKNLTIEGNGTNDTTANVAITKTGTQTGVTVVLDGVKITNARKGIVYNGANTSTNVVNDFRVVVRNSDLDVSDTNGIESDCSVQLQYSTVKTVTGVNPAAGTSAYRVIESTASVATVSTTTETKAVQAMLT